MTEMGVSISSITQAANRKIIDGFRSLTLQLYFASSVSFESKSYLVRTREIFWISLECVRGTARIRPS